MILRRTSDGAPELVEFDERTGRVSAADGSALEPPTPGHLFQISLGRHVAFFGRDDRSYFQHGSRRWSLDSRELRCRYFRFAWLECFSISAPGVGRLVHVGLVQPTLLRAWENPTYDGLDEWEDYPLMGVAESVRGRRLQARS